MIKVNFTADIWSSALEIGPRLDVIDESQRDRSRVIGCTAAAAVAGITKSIAAGDTQSVAFRALLEIMEIYGFAPTVDGVTIRSNAVKDLTNEEV